MNQRLAHALRSGCTRGQVFDLREFTLWPDAGPGARVPDLQRTTSGKTPPLGRRRARAPVTGSTGLCTRPGWVCHEPPPEDRAGVSHRGPNPDGPVDHDVPVLRVEDPDGKLRAVLLGYACHSTTLSFYQWCGDYPGFAQQYLEEAHPGATALFMAGCGADQNPYPRHGEKALESCRQHGRALANVVEAALQAPPKRISGLLKTTLEEITLDFAEPPTRAVLEQQKRSQNKYEREHAEFLLKELAQEGAITSTYPYLVQVIQFGEDLTLVALAGEVVVDFSLRLKRELEGSPVWVAGYSNDVFGYVPSLRVLREGGYEGGGAMRYTPLPGPFAPSVEERIVATVHRLVDRVRSSPNAK